MSGSRILDIDGYNFVRMSRNGDGITILNIERRAFRLFQQIGKSCRRRAFRNLDSNVTILPGPLIKSEGQCVAVLGLLERGEGYVSSVDAEEGVS